MPRSRSRSLRVHHPLGHVLVFAKRAGLPQQLVDQRGLAVVDMGDDGDIAKLHQIRPSNWRMRTSAAGRAGPHSRAKVTGTRRRADESRRPVRLVQCDTRKLSQREETPRRSPKRRSRPSLTPPVQVTDIGAQSSNFNALRRDLPAARAADAARSSSCRSFPDPEPARRLLKNATSRSADQAAATGRLQPVFGDVERDYRLLRGRVRICEPPSDAIGWPEWLLRRACGGLRAARDVSAGRNTEFGDG